ncbi:MAG: peptidase M50 [Candidatus Gottesmanbacteria bacterium GW2011_GWA2_43_14]|uniref:Peptidase M50 n=1 Tax=Candidatus Gottesmanbacteria bacterium GW2011_GWA2_43_14 TaxID=1618443 RepID=A0A0G1DC01_9BACT|nr:MAG: peptidase M50 [Candidatus Gottesmanbacteria bacterium GW2011_GWA2_43_14]
MLSLLFSNPLSFVIFAIILLAVITVHEFAHALAADRLGDPTARLAGRLTLNPLSHLDPVGTLLFLMAGFGWGKPVPFDPFNLKNPKKDGAVISFAGPLSNIIIAVTASVILRIVMISGGFGLNFFLTDILITFIRFNILLAIFNLIPVHPLDGFRVVAGLLPKKYYHDWLELERYGIIFLIMLIFPFFGSSPVSAIISPVMKFFLSLLIPGSLGGII